MDWLYEDVAFIDDVTGSHLDHKLAVEARKLEMDFFKRMRVDVKVPRWHASEAGVKVVTTKWIDVN